MKKTTLILGLALLSSGLSFGQTAEERAQITKDYDQVKLEELRQEFQQEYQIRMERATRLAKENGWELRKQLEDGSSGHLYDVVNGEPVYMTTFNRIAGIMQGANELWNGGSLGINIEGQNMEVGVWDGARVLQTHEALIGRVTAGEPPVSSGDPDDDDHATHVTGTIIANGPDNNAIGIAPQATAKYYNFANDNSEMTSEASNGMLISNHSYGIPSNNVAVAQLGRYETAAGAVDNITFNAPYYLPVMSAGNSRNTGVNIADGGYDLLTGDKLSKNAMIVGAAVGNPNYSGPSSVPMSTFSSWGPADDGRVKPDITTKGVNMYSSYYNLGNSGYATISGTSMSAPAVSGGLILLQQYYNSLNSQYMKSATVKGLALHTVKEAGAFDGPDYQFGWGLLDTEAAALAIQNNGSSTSIEELSLANSATYTKSTFSVSGGNKLVISISWTDFRGLQPFSSSDQDVDPTRKAITNDLDLVVTDASGNTYYPWSLNPASPSAAATNIAPNDVDNYEKVEIDNASGSYTITVTHKGNLIFAPQAFSLIITGADPATFSNKEDQLDSFSLFPNPATDHFTIAFNNQLSGDKINVNVYDVLGQEVMSRSFDNNGLFEQRISTANLNSGIYLVRVGNGITASTRKLIVR
ncbi:hypothetical protein BST92_11290 [Nonlabens arenilitoris]|uniref:Peptidase S8 n=1 Tax=Nonlabens arenilitoris TaxID=1217969 RepID=A0A2S7UC15_9FLAO|nr:S8 family serine peptidase [Nonlabens arenilitoris]PQJ32475.1 hypothetical protein BST92_11290 [Nonlabens arenilitoris]